MAGKPTEPIDVTGAMVTEPVPLGDWLVIAPTAWCLAMAALLLMIRKDVARQIPVAIAGLVVLLLFDAGLLMRVVEGGTINMTMGRWLPPFGITFTVDLLGAAFTLATGIVALAAGVYALVDIDRREMRYGFWSFVFLMVGGVSGAFLTGDVFNLYVWFEVLLIASFGLIILGSDTAQVDGATKDTFLNLVATTLFLIGTAFLYGITGTLNMADMAAKIPIAAIEGAAPVVTIACLYLLAFGMKAAAFPMNFWLPASYHTPHIIVSALFAGLLTKVGLYALLRTLVMMMPAARDALGTVIAIVAVLTMVTGALGALAQPDLRRMLGYLVISGIGIMLAGLALASPLGLAGAIFYALHSIVVMTALYMLAGIGGRLSGSFSLHAMGGLYRASAPVAAIALVLFFAVAGLPPFTGFWPKAALVRASLEVDAWWLAAAILLNGFIVTIAVGRAFALAWWRPAAEPATAGAAMPPDPERPPRHREDAEGLETAAGRHALAPAAPPGTTGEASGTTAGTRETVGVRETAGAAGVANATDGRLVLPLVALAALVVVFGLLPERLFTLALLAADGLLDPLPYLESVFPVGEGVDVVPPDDVFPLDGVVPPDDVVPPDGGLAPGAGAERGGAER